MQTLYYVHLIGTRKYVSFFMTYLENTFMKLISPLMFRNGSKDQSIQFMFLSLLHAAVCYLMLFTFIVSTRADKIISVFYIWNYLTQTSVDGGDIGLIVRYRLYYTEYIPIMGTQQMLTLCLLFHVTDSTNAFYCHYITGAKIVMYTTEDVDIQ